MADTPMRLLRFHGGLEHEPAIDDWFAVRSQELVSIARPWFDVMRGQGDDVRELLHDDAPTACIGDAAFGYVNVFKSHVNVGFFLGAFVDDSDGLMESSGKRMRHVKLRPGNLPDAAVLEALTRRACEALRNQIAAGAQ